MRGQKSPSSIYAGIRSSDCEVLVFYYSAGSLSGFLPDGTPISHPVFRGRQAKSELIVVFGLSDIIDLPGHVDINEHPSYKRLVLKAAKMRADRGIGHVGKDA